MLGPLLIVLCEWRVNCISIYVCVCNQIIIFVFPGPGLTDYCTKQHNFTTRTKTQLHNFINWLWQSWMLSYRENILSFFSDLLIFLMNGLFYLLLKQLLTVAVLGPVNSVSLSTGNILCVLQFNSNYKISKFIVPCCNFPGFV